MFSSVFHDAKAHIIGSNEYPKIDGFAYFKETNDGIIFTAKINGLPKPINNCKGRFFGFHIHDRNLL